MSDRSRPRAYRRQVLLTTLTAAAFLFAAASPAHAAYVDPGSGSLLLQAILAGILGVAFYFRQSVFRVLRFFRRDRPSAEELPPDNDRRSE